MMVISIRAGGHQHSPKGRRIFVSRIKGLLGSERVRGNQEDEEQKAWSIKTAVRPIRQPRLQRAGAAEAKPAPAGAVRATMATYAGKIWAQGMRCFSHAHLILPPEETGNQRCSLIIYIFVTTIF